MGDNTYTEGIMAHANSLQLTGFPIAENATKQVAGSPATAATFAKVESVTVFADVYLAAQTVFERTLQGVRTDIQAVHDNLTKCYEDIKAKDEKAGEEFKKLLDRWSNPEGFASTHNQHASSGTRAVHDAAQRAKDSGATPGTGTES